MAQVTPMDIEISNERAAELTAARAELAAARAEVTRLQLAMKGKGKGAVGKGLIVTRAGRGVRMTGEAGDRLSLAMDDLHTLLVPGDTLQNDDHIDEDESDEDGPYCPSMAHDWDGDVCKTCGTTRERWDSAPPWMPPAAAPAAAPAARAISR